MDVQHRELITLGTGAGYAFHGKGGASHMVEINGISFLLDCGEGSAGWINAQGKTNRIRYIFMTHLHTDHTAGLFPLVQNMIIDKRMENLEVFMPREGISVFQEMQKVCYLTPQINGQMEFNVVYHAIEDRLPFSTENFSLKAWYSDHFADDKKKGKPERSAFGFTIDADDNRLIYTGDISSTKCFEKELTVGTTLICEALHIDISEVIKLAVKAGLRKVIFTHSDYVNDEKTEELCSRFNYTVLAKDGMEFEW